MDDVGIPIFQAVRPLSRSLSVSQGKGTTPIASRVSAVMESFEVFHAEDPRVPSIWASVRELGAQLTYDPHDLNLRSPSVFHDDMRVEWVSAVGLKSGRTTYVPADVVNMDTRVDGTLHPITFHRDTNGLASGNTVAEATVHALYEIIERDSHAASHAKIEKERRIDPRTVTGDGAELLSQFDASNVSVQVRDVTGATGVPCFQVSIWSPTLPVTCFGAGCHADPTVAICRAFTEAAQSRVTAISGMREDIEHAVWDVLQHSSTPEPGFGGVEERDFLQTRSPWIADTLEDDLVNLVDVVQRRSGTEPLAVDLTRVDFEIPVVKVVCPGMQVYMP